MNKRVAREWGRLIRTKRGPAGYPTQEAFAAAVGVTQGTVSTWERGILSPRPVHWPAIRLLLGITDNEMERIYEAMQEAA